MVLANEILLLTREPAIERDVVNTFARWRELQIDVHRDFAELEGRMERGHVAFALIDLDPDPMGLLAELEGLVRRHADTRFVVLCSEFKNEVVLEAMQIGARHCLVKGSVSSELPSVFDRLMRGSSNGSSGEGRMVTVISAGGGCGATTVAINLANEMSSLTRGESLLVDLDLGYGGAATYLGVESDFGISDLIARGPALDAQFVRSTAAIKEGLNILLSPTSVHFEDPTPIDLNRVESVLGTLRSAFPMTVIDAPRLPVDVLAGLARASDVTLIVFELDVVDVRTARHLLTALTDRHVSRENLLFVANRYHKRHSQISVEDASEALEALPVHRIGNDYESAMRGSNLGRPLARVAPRSGLRKDLLGLAEHVRERTQRLAH